MDSEEYSNEDEEGEDEQEEDAFEAEDRADYIARMKMQKLKSNLNDQIVRSST